MTIVTDTNIWVSALMGKRLGHLTELLQSKQIRLITSEEQLSELEDVLSRQKLQHFIPAGGGTRALSNIRSMATVVDHYEHITVCRDPKDDFLLSLAISANADLLVTGDKDLLVLHPFRGIHIISYTDFEQRLTNL